MPRLRRQLRGHFLPRGSSARVAERASSTTVATGVTTSNQTAGAPVVTITSAMCASAIMAPVVARFKAPHFVACAEVSTVAARRALCAGPGKRATSASMTPGVHRVLALAMRQQR